MAKAIWSGSINFGMVNISVKMSSAVRPHDVHFNQLNSKTGNRIKMKRTDAVTGDAVPNEDIVKGYEVTKDQYVTISDAELESVAPGKTRSIDIEGFVAADVIDPIYLEASYYLSPDNGADKSYQLLLSALEKTGKIAVGKMVVRSKEYPIMIRAMGGALVITTLSYADEVLPTSELGIAPMALSEKEEALAETLVSTLSLDDFSPEKLKDTYTHKVMDMIKSKADGNEVVVSGVVDAPVPVGDLMAALSASIEAAKAARAAS